MTGERILVVDDFYDVGKTISWILEDVGYLVSYVSDKYRALELLNAETFHVSILDVRLSETDEDNQDGIWLMHEIKKKHPLVKTIIFTGYADVNLVREALQSDLNGVAPAFAFLEKTEFSQLVDYVERAFSQTT